MASVATFDILPTDYFFPQMFGLYEGASYSENFELLKYETCYFVFNMGSMVLFLWVLILALILYFALAWMESYFELGSSKLSRYLKKNLFWNVFITYLLENYLEICISSLL